VANLLSGLGLAGGRNLPGGRPREECVTRLVVETSGRVVEVTGLTLGAVKNCMYETGLRTPTSFDPDAQCTAAAVPCRAVDLTQRTAMLYLYFAWMR
jgi:hypothetical protein